MRHASGYPEKYRVDTLSRALRIYDKMLEEDHDGTRPIYRPTDWNVVARRKEKDKTKYEWSTRGGYAAPIFIPPTPNSELAISFMRIADSEAEAGVQFKMVETGGLSMNQTFAQIRILSYQLPDQTRDDRAMHQLICTNIKLTRKVLTTNLIRTILRKNVGTMIYGKTPGR